MLYFIPLETVSPRLFSLLLAAADIRVAATPGRDSHPNNGSYLVVRVSLPLCAALHLLAVTRNGNNVFTSKIGDTTGSVVLPTGAPF